MVDSHSEFQTTLPKSKSKTMFNPVAGGKYSASSVFVCHSLDSNDTITRKINKKLTKVNSQDLTLRRKSVCRTLKEFKPFISLIILNLEESNDHDYVKRYAHKL